MTASNPLSSDAIAEQLGEAYEALPQALRERLPPLLDEIRRPPDVGLDLREWDEPDTRLLAVAAADRPGAFSLIAGLLAARGIDIVRADAFTFRREAPVPARPRVRGRAPRPRPGGPPGVLLLDLFVVRLPEASAGDAAAIESLRSDLAEVFGLLAKGDGDAARELVLRQFAGALPSRPREVLWPARVEVDNEADPEATLVVVTGGDTEGFLFEFTNALAVLDLVVRRAEVRTEGGEARDAFWVTTTGGAKLEDPSRIDELRVAAVLIKQFTHALPHAPDPAQALRQFGSFVRGMAARPDRREGLRDLADQAVLDTLAEMLGVSRFLWEDFLRLQHEQLFPVLTSVPELANRKTLEELRAELAADGALDEEELNAFKDRELFRIDLRHITRRVGFVDFSHELSDLAEVIVGEAAALAGRRLAAAGQEAPRRADGGPCRWTLAALGKFGGRELGFASDLELALFHEETGEAGSAGASYFDGLMRELHGIIHAPREGIFEIDLRLRPHGEGGPLSFGIEAARDYYRVGGVAEQLERMALAKLRPIAGDPALGAELEALRDAFTYSGEPLDYENIRALRERQIKVLVTPGTVNAKYSHGGLVDVEYYVQAQQIEAGATDPTVRHTNTLEAIEALSQAGWLDFDDAAKLPETYGFLRRLIDAMRVVRGHAKDLAIPPQESLDFAYLTRRLYYERPEALAEAIEVRMAYAHSLWESRES